MKKLLLALCLFGLLSAVSTFAQEEGEKKIPERLKFFKEKYEKTFNQSFDIVFKGVIKAFEKENVYLQTKNKNRDEAGLGKGLIKTDFQIIASGSENDTSCKTLDKYSTTLVIIRGGIWETARVQYTVKITENKDGSTLVSLKGKLSGFERYVTKKIHDYESNGILENELTDKITAAIEEVAQGK